MKRELLTTLMVTILIFLSGCSGNGIKLQSNLTMFNDIEGKEPNTTEYHYEINLQGSEADLKKLKLKEVILNSKLDSIIIDTSVAIGENTKDELSNQSLYTISGTVLLNTTGLSQKEKQIIQPVERVILKHNKDEIIEVEMKE